MESFFQGILNLQAPFNMVVIVVMISCAAAVIKFVATEIRKFGCHRQDIEFKRELIDRGMSVDEITKLVAAGASGDDRPVTVQVGNYVGGAPQNSPR
ncbi:MAG TPA: hypothetical protein VGM76_06945 [Lacipirellulaceae bacterium]|jgi:hypothetical protein